MHIQSCPCQRHGGLAARIWPDCNPRRWELILRIGDSVWFLHLWQSDLSCDKLPFLSIPRQPLVAAAPQPIMSMHTSLLPGENSSGVRPRIEELPSLHMPPLPANKTVGERRPTARCRYIVCAILHGICVFLCTFAHPYSVPDTAAPLSSRENRPKAARTRTRAGQAAGRTISHTRLQNN